MSETTSAAHEMALEVDRYGEGFTQLEWWQFLTALIRELEVRKEGAATMLIAAGYKRVYEGWLPDEQHMIRRGAPDPDAT